MIPNHKQFIAAVMEKKKVSLRLFSKADSGVVDLVCAPMDYGAVGEVKDGVNRYEFWDYSANNGTHILTLLPEQVLSLSVLGSLFDPAEFGALPTAWLVPRDWGRPTAVPGTPLADQG